MLKQSRFLTDVPIASLVQIAFIDSLKSYGVVRGADDTLKFSASY
ncbi:hypothetical protein [Phormidium tenue]|nr:hypothetical protein [Phormidium tenue]